MTISPKYVAAAREFQQTFSVYFPKMENDIDDAALEMEWLTNSVWGNPLTVARRQKIKRSLEVIGKSLKRIGQFDTPYWDNLMFQIFESKGRGDNDADCIDEIFKFLLTLSQWHGEGSLSKVVDRFVNEAQAATDKLPEAGNINWEAVHAVDRLRILWRRNMGSGAPARALNPATKFAQYLKDGFQYLGISADPISAFKRWAEISKVDSS
jgi:hypothetical protein